MERRISATEARVHFGELMRKVCEEGEAYIVERDGKPQVVVLSAADYERLNGSSEQKDWRAILARIARLRGEILAEAGGELTPPPEEMLRQAREERDEQLTSLR
jgi:prevent-host-death family protein